VLVSAILFRQSAPFQVLMLALGNHVLLRSEETMRELRDVLSREKFDRHQPREKREDFVSFFHEFAEPVEIRSQFAISDDPNDDKFLDLAVDGAADFLISGDDHLLRLHSVRGIPILKPLEFLGRTGN